MSRRWQGLPPTPSHEACVSKDKEHLDLAAKCASLLEAIHFKSLNDPGLSTDEIFQFDITSDLDIIRSGSISSPRSSAAPTGTAIESCRLYTADNSSLAAGWVAPEAMGPNHMQDQALNLNTQQTNSETRNAYSPPSPASMSAVYSRLRKRPAPDVTYAAAPWTEPRHPRTNMTQELALDPITAGDLTNGMGELTEDELTAMSDRLLEQSFSELDRVITLDGTDFNFDMSYWGRNECV